jgi:hypothetical protein
VGAGLVRDGLQVRGDLAVVETWFVGVGRIIVAPPARRDQRLEHVEALSGGVEGRRGCSVSPSGGAVLRELISCPVPMSRTSGGVDLVEIDVSEGGLSIVLGLSAQRACRGAQSRVSRDCRSECWC